MSDGAVPHRHDWGGMAFELEGDRPIAVQACACGRRRTIRAWEAYWEPAGAPAAHPAGRVPIPRPEAATAVSRDARAAGEPEPRSGRGDATGG